MKYLFILLLGLSLSAGEIGRIKSIIEDVESLRVDYTVCFNAMKVQNEEVSKNNILVSKVKTLENILKIKR